MKLTAYFTSANAPALGLTPTISVWELDGAIAVNTQSMTEIAGGFYVYDFIGYDYTKEYVIQGYESTLAPSEQYVIGSNDVDSQNQQGAIKEILGLSQSDMTITGQSYDTSGRLLTAVVNTFTYETDATGGINPLHEYNITCTYDGTGNLTKYIVTKGS